MAMHATLARLFAPDAHKNGIICTYTLFTMVHRMSGLTQISAAQNSPSVPSSSDERSHRLLYSVGTQFNSSPLPGIAQRQQWERISSENCLHGNICAHRMTNSVDAVRRPYVPGSIRRPVAGGPRTIRHIEQLHHIFCPFWPFGERNSKKATITRIFSSTLLPFDGVCVCPAMWCSFVAAPCCKISLLAEAIDTLSAALGGNMRGINGNFCCCCWPCILTVILTGKTVPEECTFHAADR